MYDILSVLEIPDMYLRTKLILKGYFTGIHRVPYKGVSAEFSQYRDYVQGDDFKRVDFKLFRRTEKFYVKESESEINADIHIFLDTSKSMSFRDKARYSQTLLFLMAYIGFRQSDNIGYGVFSDTLRIMRKPSRKSNLLPLLIKDLAHIQYSGKTDINAALEPYLQSMGRNAFVIMITDCADKPSRIDNILRTLRTMGNDVILFHVNDHMETNRRVLTEMRLKDSETGDILDSNDADELLRQFNAHLDILKANALKNNYDYVHFFTNEGMNRALEAFFRRRHA